MNTYKAYLITTTFKKHNLSVTSIYFRTFVFNLQAREAMMSEMEIAFSPSFYD